MMHSRYDIACCFLILFFILRPISGNFQDFVNIQQRAVYLPDTKFGFNEYSDYSETDDKGSLTSKWNQVVPINHNGRAPKFNTNKAQHFANVFDKNIVWDSNWGQNLKFGQISAVSIDPKGNIAIFHRGSRVWGSTTFNERNVFDHTEGPIQENTIVLLDKFGRKLVEWGKHMFYLPHGLTIDAYGNYWITDVAMHQVFKFDAKDIEKHIDDLKKERLNRETMPYNAEQDLNNMDQNSILKPSLTLGVPFEPGNDEIRFCKPTAVAVQKNGDFFVSDGYCNSRIIKFNATGGRILLWGRHWELGGKFSQLHLPNNAFVVPHALALSNEHNYIFVADRENGRVVCFFASNGTFHKEYKHRMIGTKVYSIAYANEKLYLINGPDPYSDPVNNYVHVQGFVLDINSGDIVSQFGPGKDMDRPHDIAVTENGSEIYVVELDIQIVYRFLQDVNTTAPKGNSVIQGNPHHEPAPLTDSNSNNLSAEGTATATLVLSLVTAAVVFIALCVAIAAIVARCQKRGCLLTMRKRMRWEAEKRENFKLANFLESRRSKNFKVLEKRPNPRDFSKLNTEPETSEDEHPAFRTQVYIRAR